MLSLCANILAQGDQINAINPDLSLHQYNLKTRTSLKDMHASQVWDIAQDETGYFWLGTNDGVFRSDWKHYQHPFNFQSNANADVCFRIYSPTLIRIRAAKRLLDDL